MLRIVATLTVLGCCALVWVWSQDGDDGASPHEADVPVPTVSAAEAVGYVGSEACQPCHQHEYDVWLASAHAPVASRLEPSKARGAVAVGGRWMQAYARPDARGYHRFLPRCLDLRVDEWRSVEAVLAEISGIPVGRGRDAVRAVAARSFDTDCSGCHASGAVLGMDLEAGRLQSTWRAMACDCEACHGPGRAHVEAPDPRGTLPRLGRLDARTATAVCARCHGGPQTVGDYAPADAVWHVGILGHRRGVFADGTARGQIYQHAGFLRSPCHTQGSLVCAHCHEPHAAGRTDPAQVDALCRTCHPTFAGPAHSHHDPAGSGGRCVACHMPRLLDGLLAHTRDHRIGVPVPAVAEAPDACTACHDDLDKAGAQRAWRGWWGPPPQDLLEAVRTAAALRSGAGSSAGAIEALRASPDPFFRVTAAMVTGRPGSALDDPLPEVRLAAVRNVRGGERTAVLRRALQDAHPVIRAEAWLGLGAEAPPLTPRTRADLSIAVRRRRDLVEGRLVLAQRFADEGDAQAALVEYERAVVFAPMSVAAWEGVLRSALVLERKTLIARARSRLGELESAPRR